MKLNPYLSVKVSRDPIWLRSYAVHRLDKDQRPQRKKLALITVYGLSSKLVQIDPNWCE